MAFASNDFHDGIAFTGARTANTVGPFYLLGGRYTFSISTPSTSATLQQLMPDGSSYITPTPAYGTNPLTAAGDMKLPVVSLAAKGEILFAVDRDGQAWCQGNNGSMAARGTYSWERLDFEFG